MTPPLVILHGALGSAAQMAPVAAELASRWDPIVIEFAGHGATPRGATPASIGGLVSYLSEQLRTRQLERPLVFGYSMGGYVALALASAAPDTFSGIVTLGTKFAWTPETAAREVRRLDADTIRAKVPAFAATLEARYAAGDGWTHVLDTTAQLLRDLGDTPVLTSMGLAAVRSPVVCAVGSLDDTVSADETTRAADAMGGRAVVLPGVRHPIEQLPEGTTTALMRWLTDGGVHPFT